MPSVRKAKKRTSVQKKQTLVQKKRPLDQKKRTLVQKKRALVQKNKRKQPSKSVTPRKKKRPDTRLSSRTKRKQKVDGGGRGKVAPELLFSGLNTDNTNIHDKHDTKPFLGTIANTVYRDNYDRSPYCISEPNYLKRDGSFINPKADYYKPNLNGHYKTPKPVVVNTYSIPSSTLSPHQPPKQYKKYPFPLLGSYKSEYNLTEEEKNISRDIIHYFFSLENISDILKTDQLYYNAYQNVREHILWTMGLDNEVIQNLLKDIPNITTTYTYPEEVQNYILSNIGFYLKTQEDLYNPEVYNREVYNREVYNREVYNSYNVSAIVWDLFHFMRRLLVMLNNLCLEMDRKYHSTYDNKLQSKFSTLFRNSTKSKTQQEQYRASMMYYSQKSVHVYNLISYMQSDTKIIRDTDTELKGHVNDIFKDNIPPSYRHGPEEPITFFYKHKNLNL